MIRVGGEKAAASIQAAIDELAELAAALGTRYDVLIDLPPVLSARLGWFTEGTAQGMPARNVFEYNAVAAERVETAMRVQLATRGRVPVLIALQAGAQAFRELAVERLETGGGDLRFDALTPDYAAQKARRGQSTLPGVARGDTRDALRAALVVIRKRS